MEQQSNEEQPLICVLCGTPWGMFNNVCDNKECNGFCTWGHELNKPLSYTIEENGKWTPNDPKVSDEDLMGTASEFVAGELDKSVKFGEYLKSETPRDYLQEIRDASYTIVKRDFDMDKIFNFCQEHRVEILLQEDTMMHCFIDWHLEEGKKGSWAIEFDSFTCLVRGIDAYIEYKKLNPDAIN